MITVALTPDVDIVAAGGGRWYLARYSDKATSRSTYRTAMDASLAHRNHNIKWVTP